MMDEFLDALPPLQMAKGTRRDCAHKTFGYRWLIQRSRVVGIMTVFSLVKGAFSCRYDLKASNPFPNSPSVSPVLPSRVAMSI